VTGAARPPACTGRPLSWLLLERHALGDLPARQARRVRAHLASCAVCASCAAEAGATSAPVPGQGGTPRRSWWRRYAVGWATTATLACAAGGFLLMARGREPSVRAPGGTLPGVKGGEVALELVREREGTISHGAERFTPGDRWKALVTCPAGHVLFWDVTVREGQGGPTQFPLAPSGPIACGNHVALPGAFRLSGSAPVQVCVRLTADPLPRESSTHVVPVTAQNLCATVHPEP